jgi:hypothetical protein
MHGSVSPAPCVLRSVYAAFKRIMPVPQTEHHAPASSHAWADRIRALKNVPIVLRMLWD